MKELFRIPDKTTLLHLITLWIIGLFMLVLLYLTNLYKYLIIAPHRTKLLFAVLPLAGFLLGEKCK